MGRQGMNDRSNWLDALLQAAWQAQKNAYVPYSHFAVGAAVLGESGKTYGGANVENASYGLTVCAERVAIFSAIAAGERAIGAIAVVGSAQTVTPPCGACRQVLSEFGAGIPVIGESPTGERRSWTIESLL